MRKNIGNTLCLNVSDYMVICIFDHISRTNLVKNPGFEASSGKPENWTITGPVVTMQPVTVTDNLNRFSGQYGLKMESSNPNCHGRAVQTVPVKGGQTYLFSARFRTEKIMSIHKNVLIRVRWLLDKEQIGYNFIYDIAGESDGWFLAIRQDKGN